MSSSPINYLFPPDQIHNLATWRFVLHFMVTPQFDQAMLPRAVERLKASDWSIGRFPVRAREPGIGSERAHGQCADRGAG